MLTSKNRLTRGYAAKRSAVLVILVTLAAAPVHGQDDADPLVATEGEDRATITTVQERRSYHHTQTHSDTGEITIGMTLGGALEEDRFRVLDIRVLDAMAGGESLIRDGEAGAHHRAVRIVQGHEQDNAGRDISLVLKSPEARLDVIDRLEVSVLVAPESSELTVDLGVVADQETRKPLATEALANTGIRIEFDDSGNEGTTLRLLVQDPQRCLMEIQGLKPDGTVIEHQSIHIHPRNDGELWFVFLNDHRGDVFDPETDGLRLTLVDHSAVEDREFFFQDLPLP